MISQEETMADLLECSASIYHKSVTQKQIEQYHKLRQWEKVAMDWADQEQRRGIDEKLIVDMLWQKRVTIRTHLEHLLVEHIFKEKIAKEDRDFGIVDYLKLTEKESTK